MHTSLSLIPNCVGVWYMLLSCEFMHLWQRASGMSQVYDVAVGSTQTSREDLCGSHGNALRELPPGKLCETIPPKAWPCEGGGDAQIYILYLCLFEYTRVHVYMRYLCFDLLYNSWQHSGTLCTCLFSFPHMCVYTSTCLYIHI